MAHLTLSLRFLPLLNLQRSTSTREVQMPLRQEAPRTQRKSENIGSERPRWIKPVVYAVLAVTLIGAALPTLLYPLTRDQGIYAYIADLQMHGGAPYGDAWELKPPGVYFAYWAAFLLFGRSEFAVRLFDVLYALLSAASVYALAFEVFEDRLLAVGSAWIYAFCYYFLVHFHSVATPEAFMVPFLVASVYGVVRGVRLKGGFSGFSLSSQGLALLFGGVASGFVFWFKPTAGLPVVAVLAWACVRMWRERWSNRMMMYGLGLFILGGLLGLLPISLYLYGHGLRELLDIWRAYGTGTYLQARGLALGAGPLAMLDVVMTYLRNWQLPAWLSLAGAVGVLAWRRRNRRAEAIVVFWLFSVAATLLQGKLFEYHWIPVLAPLAVLSAFSLVWLARESGGRVSNVLCDMRSTFAVVVIAGLCLWMGYDQLPRYRSSIAYALGQQDTETYYAQFNLGKDFSYMGTRRAATYLREHTSPGETALVWGVEPLVNFLAERRSPTNFISFYVLVSGQNTNPRLDAWRQDFLNDIRGEAPAYIILVENDVTPLAPVGSRAQLDEFPTFQKIVENEYEFEAQVEDYLFYHRRKGALVPRQA